MQWRPRGKYRAESEQGHIAIKYFDGAYYAIFSPNPFFLGILHGDFSGIDEFLANPPNPEPQTQEMLL